MQERPSDPAAWERLRQICAEFDAVSERTSHGELAWFVGASRRPRQFATTWDHHHDDRNAVVMSAPPGAQDQFLAADARRYFRPAYVGAKGWIGVYLDPPYTDWDLIALHLADAHHHVAGLPRPRTRASS